ncbi:Ger(x)C family spore germination C-terminal domain-containing protein [Paenibacillus sp. P26]|nr:Ger(x)C family spore germination C-terminal domain-containing protein [Paenibacillus sp. P26]UUZ92936.1 Ger(x)C family spore germination C-terminal domain-containing protein [Paenibacillus sp. P25]
MKLKGSALLDHQGRYVLSLGYQETVLLQILQNQADKPASLTLSIPGEPKHGLLHLNKLSFNTGKTKTKIKTAYRQGKFRFDLNVDMSIWLTERLFPYDMRKKRKELENTIAGQMQKEFETLIGKIKRKRIDPFGFGLNARAYEYNAFKKAEDRWGKYSASRTFMFRFR